MMMANTFSLLLLGATLLTGLVWLLDRFVLLGWRRRRVLKALEEAPLWEPATKNGTPVASEGVLRIQLPEDKPLPRLPELIWR